MRPFLDDDVLFCSTATYLCQQVSVPVLILSIHSNIDLKEITDTFCLGVVLKDCRWYFKIYRNCFIRTHAVDFFLASKMAKSRKKAVKIGRDFMKTLGLFHHVTDENDFEDGYAFYQLSPGPVHVQKHSVSLQNRLELHATAKQFEQQMKVKGNYVGFWLYRETISGKEASNF